MTAGKRVDIVSIKMVKESSILYQKRKVTSPRDAYDLIKGFLDDKDREHFIAVYLDVKNQPVAIHTVSIGSLNASIVHPREVFKAGLQCNAGSIILGHNHPSGIANPSIEDERITERLVEAGKILGISITDHIIVGDDSYYSFREMDRI